MLLDQVKGPSWSEGGRVGQGRLSGGTTWEQNPEEHPGIRAAAGSASTFG